MNSISCWPVGGTLEWTHHLSLPHTGEDILTKLAWSVSYEREHDPTQISHERSPVMEFQLIKFTAPLSFSPLDPGIWVLKNHPFILFWIAIALICAWAGYSALILVWLFGFSSYRQLLLNKLQFSSWCAQMVLMQMLGRFRLWKLSGEQQNHL